MFLSNVGLGGGLLLALFNVGSWHIPKPIALHAYLKIYIGPC